MVKNEEVILTQEEKQKKQNEAEKQIKEKSKIFDYDTIEYPIEVIVMKYLKNIDEDKNELYIPDYQREFVWDNKRKSKFIESLLMGLPIPYIFIADVEGRYEIVDGSQRIRTLVEFLLKADFIDENIRKTSSNYLKSFNGNSLKLENLKTLTELNGFVFNDLIESRQSRLRNRSLKMIKLSENTDVESRKELFERINTGSDELLAMEVRKGVYEGRFYSFVKECANNNLFKKLCPISEKTALREEGEERVLRFFAFSNSFDKYDGKVREFIDEYIEEVDKIFNEELKKQFKKQFEDMLNFVGNNFPYGFKKTENSISTPRVRFEAISLGVDKALRESENIDAKNILKWLESDKFKEVTTTDAANNKSKVKGRIEFVKDKLLGK